MYDVAMAVIAADGATCCGEVAGWYSEGDMGFLMLDGHRYI